MKIPSYLPARRRAYAPLLNPMPELPAEPTTLELMVAALAWLRRASEALSQERDELAFVDSLPPVGLLAEAELALARMRAYRREANRCQLWAERCGLRITALRWQQAIAAAMPPEPDPSAASPSTTALDPGPEPDQAFTLIVAPAELLGGDQ